MLNHLGVVPSYPPPAQVRAMLNHPDSPYIQASACTNPHPDPNPNPDPDPDPNPYPYPYPYPCPNPNANQVLRRCPLAEACPGSGEAGVLPWQVPLIRFGLR